MPRCPVPETKPVVAGATLSVRTTSTDPTGCPRTRIVSFPPRRTAARSLPNAARPSESVERVSVATPMSGPSGRNETASPGTAFPKESRTVTSSEMGPRAPARTSTWPGCTAATTGPAGPTTTSSGGVPWIDAPEPVTISNVYVAGARPTGNRNTAVPLASVTACASCGGPPGITPPHLHARHRLAPHGDGESGGHRRGGEGERGRGPALHGRRASADTVEHVRVGPEVAQIRPIPWRGSKGDAVAPDQVRDLTPGDQRVGEQSDHIRLTQRLRPLRRRPTRQSAHEEGNHSDGARHGRVQDVRSNRRSTPSTSV